VIRVWLCCGKDVNVISKRVVKRVVKAILGNCLVSMFVSLAVYTQSRLAM